MAHFAQINDQNIVINIITINDNDCCGGIFPSSDICGQTYINTLGLNGNWKQTSYNNNFRRIYAGIGYFYNSDLDIFIEPQPFPSWVFDTESQTWQAPKPIPDGDNIYYWDESVLDWRLHERLN